MTATLPFAPVTFDAPALAQGLLALFTQEERTILRIGMLPAAKMESLTRSLTAKFQAMGEPLDPDNPADPIRLSWDPAQRKTIEWDTARAVRDIVHQVTLEIYSIGDLVV